MKGKLTELLKENEYSDVEFDNEHNGEFNFFGYVDAEVEIQVRVENDTYKVYDRYITDKHYTYLATFDYLKDEDKFVKL